MIKLGETCNCGRHHISPVPFKCSRCNKDMRTGCLEGESYRVVDRATIASEGPRSFVKYGGFTTIRTEKVDDEFGKMTIEFLNPTEKDNSGTSLFPR
jgi:hypothetical protein